MRRFNAQRLTYYAVFCGVTEIDKRGAAGVA